MVNDEPKRRVVSKLAGGPDFFIANPDGLPDLYLFDLTEQDGQAIRLTTDPACELYPYGSPDGQQILFSRSYGNNLDLAVTDADGRNLNTSSNEYAPAWSLDGRFIAFDSNESGKLLLSVMPAEGGPASLLSPPFP
jgi:TolB protein